jgi:hypothetical protein
MLKDIEYIQLLLLLNITTHYYLLYILGAIIIIVCIIKKHFISAIILPAMLMSLAVTFFLPIFLGISDLDKMKYGINEYLQDKITDIWGIENFYTLAQKSIKNDILESKLRYDKNFYGLIWNDAYVGSIKYSKEPPRFISEITVLSSPVLLSHSDSNFIEVKWRENFIFSSNDKLISILLKCNALKYICLFLTFEFIFLLIFFSCEKFNKLPRTLKKIYLGSIVFIPLFLFPTIIVCTRGLYFKPSSILAEISEKKNLDYLADCLRGNSFPFGSRNSIYIGGNKYDMFISRDNFFPSDYIRVNIDIFQYVFYAEKQSDIICSSNMVVVPIGDHLYYGYYKNYIKIANQSFVFLFSLVLLQIIAGIIFIVKYFRRNRICKIKLHD